MAPVVKNPPANAGDIRDMGSTPGSGRSPGWGNGNLVQYSCLENPMDRAAWYATVHRVTESWTQLKQFSMHECIHFSQHCLLKRLLSPHHVFLALLSKINWLYIYGHTSGLYSVLLVHMTVIMLVPRCCVYCSFIIYFKSGSMMSPGCSFSGLIWLFLGFCGFMWMSTANIILNGQNLKYFYLKSWIKQECAPWTFLFNTVLEGLAPAIRQKEKKT